MANRTHPYTGINTTNEDLLYEVNHEFAMTILPVTVMLAGMSVVGVIGNIMIILVYSKQYDRTNFRYFVLFLAFNDLVSCTTCMPAEVFTQLNWYQLTYSWLCRGKAYFNLWTSWTSATILLLFSYDRFRKIHHPLKLQIRPSLALKLCAGLMMAMAVIAGPGAVLGWTSISYELPSAWGNVTVTVCGKWDFLPPQIYTPIFYFYILGILVMMVALTALNMVTARKILCGESMLASKTDTQAGVVEVRSSRYLHDSSVSNNTITEYLSKIEDDNEDDGEAVDQNTNDRNVFRNDSNNKQSNNSQADKHEPSKEIAKYQNEAYERDKSDDSLKSNGEDGLKSNGDDGQKSNNDDGLKSNGDDVQKSNSDNGLKSNGDDVQKSNSDNVLKSNGDDGQKSNNDDGLKSNGDDVQKSNSDNGLKSNGNDVQKSNSDNVLKSNGDDDKLRNQNKIQVYQKPHNSNKRSSVVSRAPNESYRPHSRKIRSNSVKDKRTQKLFIMFALAMVFVVTMTIWVSVTVVITPKLNQNSLTDTEKVLYFIAWRLYFINYMVNPFLYGFMDQRFRMGLKHRICGR